MPQVKIVDLSELTKKTLPDSKSIDEILNKPIVIKAIEVYPDVSKYGDIFHIVTADNERYRSTSQVLNKQLAELKEAIEKNNIQVKCKIVKKKRYYILASAQ
ncbi:MAG: hypothetical protein QXL51_06230 [Candidatus Aenigmatarchaeota archaeon]